MKSFLRILASALVASLILAPGIARADDVKPDPQPTRAVGGNIVLGNNTAGASVEARYRNPDPYAPAWGDAEIGVVATNDGHGRVIGNLGGVLCIESPVCIGNPRFVHADGTYVELSPFPVSLGFEHKETTFLIGPRLLVIRDQDRHVTLTGGALEAYFERTLGHEADISLLAQLASMSSTDVNQRGGMFYDLEAKFREKLSPTVSANVGLEISDAPLKELDASGNSFGSWSTNPSFVVKGGLTRTW